MTQAFVVLDNKFDDQNESSPVILNRQISLYERILKTQKIWHLPYLNRNSIICLLNDKPNGVFKVFVKKFKHFYSIFSNQVYIKFSI